MTNSYDVIIIGAGQAGLTAGYFLKKTNKSFLILDFNKKIGDSWRNRYDSLELFSPRALSALPGMKHDGIQDDYPTKDEIAEYLEKYAKKLEIPIKLNTKVIKLERDDDTFRITIESGKTLIARNVILATGAHPTPFIPKISEDLSSDIFQIHSSVYKNSTQIPEGKILIVGAGNSGAQIAYELSKTKNVYLSCGHKPLFVPKRILGKSLFWWLKNTGILNIILSIPTATFLGKYFFKRQNKLIIGTELKEAVKNKKIIIKPRLIGIKNNIAKFSDESEEIIDSVIWATGFKQDFNWIKIPEALDENGNPKHKRGVSNVSGLHFLGLPELHSIGSGLFSGIAKDAKYVISQIQI